MVPGEYFFDSGSIEINSDRPTCTVQVNNTGDRPVQVGSHFHFFEVNKALRFDRDQAYGMRLDIPAGTAIRFAPGEKKTVRLVALGGSREMYGGSGLVMGRLDDAAVCRRAFDNLRKQGFANTGKGEGPPVAKPKPKPLRAPTMQVKKKDTST
jgi:urease beta subunit